jgi:hypothetical protein
MSRKPRKKRLKKTGIFKNEDGVEECWWDGKNYHQVIPEELIDYELDKTKNQKGN